MPKAWLGIGIYSKYLKLLQELPPTSYNPVEIVIGDDIQKYNAPFYSPTEVRQRKRLQQKIEAAATRLPSGLFVVKHWNDISSEPFYKELFTNVRQLYARDNDFRKATQAVSTKYTGITKEPGLHTVSLYPLEETTATLVYSSQHFTKLGPPAEKPFDDLSATAAEKLGFPKPSFTYFLGEDFSPPQ